jgi:hypothetical protein
MDFLGSSKAKDVMVTTQGRAICGNLENKINTLYWPVENSIPKNNNRSRL